MSVPENSNPETNEKNLESKVEEFYSVKDVLKHPLKSAFGEIFTDMNFIDLFSGKTETRKRVKRDLSILASLSFIVVPHELMHAGANVLCGNANKEIVINKLYGGDLWAYIIPGIESKLISPLIGGYVRAEFASYYSFVATSMAPYAMTPVGIYLLYKGKEKKSLTASIFGAGITGVHASGILGDFFSTGIATVYNSADSFYKFLGYNGVDTESNLSKFLLLAGGLYLGTKIMGFSYRFSKACINYLRNTFKK